MPKLTKVQQKVLNQLKKGRHVRFELAGYFWPSGERVRYATIEKILDECPDIIKATHYWKISVHVSSTHIVHKDFAAKKNGKWVTKTSEERP
jgi:hypothetical protein